MSEPRKYLPSFSDLVDRLTVDQIKSVLLDSNKEQVGEEIDAICHDIDLVLQQHPVELNADLVRKIIILAQMNLHIWHLKDEMAKDESRYMEFLKLAHQLNGVRNQAKNALLQDAGDGSTAKAFTNTEIDGLKGWDGAIVD
ncbi:MAG: hypothetical protein VXZ35_03430 [Pseudomonadota bacterium]|nr:hypothetical protein [Pseudomonadota bacterium]